MRELNQEKNNSPWLRAALAASARISSSNDLNSHCSSPLRYSSYIGWILRSAIGTGNAWSRSSLTISRFCKICVRLSSNRFLSFSLDTSFRLSSKFWIVPNCRIRAEAVFEPIPSTPGILSTALPIFRSPLQRREAHASPSGASGPSYWLSRL